MSMFPEEYIDGYVIFCGLRFRVDERALIPRLETEELVKYTLRLLQEHPEIQTVVDIGTGSGIIPISIASKSERALTILATDLSRVALDLAKENITSILEKNQIPSSLELFQGSLLEPIIHHFSYKTPDDILITANLPYVREKEINSGLTHEPRMAFLGGAQTGFELYKEFFLQIMKWKHRPKNCHIVIEFGLWQRDIAETVFQQHGWDYRFFKDLRGIERFAYVIL